MNARRRFWLVSIAALLAVALTLALGRWQLSRAAQKLVMQQALEAAAVMPALDNQALAALPDQASALHRRVLLRGQWIAQHTVWLDNRQMGGKVGLYVMTPLRLEGSAAVILVQRGWLARNFLERTALAPLQTPAVPVQVQGYLASAPASLYELGHRESGPIRQNLDLGAFASEVGAPLGSVSVVQTGAASEGLLRDWPLVGSGVEKHYGYAFQWFSLSALIASLYVWFQIVRRFVRPRSA